MSTLLLLLTILLAGAMGYAIQRGATCTVAAVDELLTKGRAHRFLALLEASLWVLAGLLLLRALNAMPPMPAGYSLGVWTVAGAVLLGLGAAVNRACVFGAIARFGSGDWAYLATPLGFYLGSLGAQMLVLPFLPQTIRQAAPDWQPPTVLIWPLLAWLLWRVRQIWLRAHTDTATPAYTQRLSRAVWAPHEATLVIGMTFLLLLWLAGPWTYTELLAEWSRGMTSNTASRGLLFLALLGGAVWGGQHTGRWQSQPITAAGLLRCLLGGALMGLGSSLIPGGNDGLILTGLPLLWPYAWVAFLTMCLTIGVYLKMASWK